MPSLDDNGHEVLDPTPVAIPVRIQAAPSILQEMLDMRRLVREEISRAADQAHLETFAEADDFDVGEDDGMPYSPHELEGEALLTRWEDFLKEGQPPEPPVENAPSPPPGPPEQTSESTP